MALTIKFLLRDFAEWTTIPGPIQIVYALNSLFRFLWVIIWLGLFTVFIYQVYLIAEKLLSYPSQIHGSINFGAKVICFSICFRPVIPQPRFPIVTICNQNPYKLDVIKSNPNFSSIALLMSDYQKMVDSGYDDISDDHFGLNTAGTRFQKESWARKALVLLAAQLPSEALPEATYSFEEFVKFCYFNNLPCPRSSFSSYMDATYGACYQFNVLSDFQTYRAGSYFGLRILLLANQIDPTGNLLYLPTTNAAGVRVSVQNLDVDPAIDRIYRMKEALVCMLFSCVHSFFSSHLCLSFGINCAVGNEVTVTLQMTATTLMKEPYGECVDDADGAANYYTDKAYTIENCLRSCKQNRALFVCGCADPRYNKPRSSSYCNVSKVGCLLGLQGQNKKNSFSPVRDCGCFPPCEQFYIRPYVSNAKFPSKNFAVLNNPDSDPPKPNLIYSCFPSYSCVNPNSLFGGDMRRCIQWYEKNSLVLNFWYDGLDYEAQNEKASYTLTQASNDLGGNMGVWLGISVISLIEVIALIIMIILFLAYGRKVKIAPSQEELNEDVRYKNIQDLKEELDKHERIDDRVRTQIQKQNEDAATKRAHIQVQHGRAREIASQAAARLHDAKAAHDQDPDNVAALAALANAQAVVNATSKHLKRLQQSYSLL